MCHKWHCASCKLQFQEVCSFCFCPLGILPPSLEEVFLVKKPGLKVWKKRGYVCHRQIIPALESISQQPALFARNVSEAIWEHLASVEPSSMRVTSSKISWRTTQLRPVQFVGPENHGQMTVALRGKFLRWFLQKCITDITWSFRINSSLYYSKHLLVLWTHLHPNREILIINTRNKF